jgi:hypothetical protein
MVASDDGAAVRVDDRLHDGQADPESVRLRRDKGQERRAEHVRGQARSGVAHGDVDIGAITSLLMVTRRRANGVSAMASTAFTTRFTKTCDVGALVRVRPEIEDFRDLQGS